MSHGDKLSELPTGFCTVATTQNSPYAGIAHEKDPIFGIQFHPEVTFVSPSPSLSPSSPSNLLYPRRTTTDGLKAHPLRQEAPPELRRRYLRRKGQLDHVQLHRPGDLAHQEPGRPQGPGPRRRRTFPSFPLLAPLLSLAPCTNEL